MPRTVMPPNSDRVIPVVDPLAPVDDREAPPLLVTLDSAVRNWNAEAKHRLRLAGWPVQGGMTVHTVDLMRAWMEDVLRGCKPVAAHLTLPAEACFPDLTSPNACLLACSLLPVLRGHGIPLCVELEERTEPGQWETRALPGRWEDTRDALAAALGSGRLWRVDGAGRAEPA